MGGDVQDTLGNVALAAFQSGAASADTSMVPIGIDPQ
jgi:hypothetical protein